MPLGFDPILVTLSDAPGRTLRLSDLAERTWSSGSRLSHAIDRLEEKGWVERIGCPSDKRGAFALLTDAGFAVLEAAAPSHVARVRRHLFDQLTPSQVDALGPIIQQVTQRPAACPTK